jgi:hypothetical protein
MSEHKIKEGDLVSIEPWDCEGIEPPWGVDCIMLERTSSRLPPKVKIVPGTVGMVVGNALTNIIEDSLSYFIVIVGERKLRIPFRFLHVLKS